MDLVPPEILSHIFWLGLDLQAGFYEAQYSPCLPSQVCGQWREIAHYSPELWSRISLDSNRLRSSSSPTVVGFQTRLSSFLLHSKVHPLRINASIISLPEILVEMVKIFMEMLWPYRDRWKTFSLNTPDYALASLWIPTNLPDTPATAMPVFTKLSLSLRNRWVQGYNLKLVRSFKDSPSLTSLSLALPRRVYEDAQIGLRGPGLPRARIRGCKHLSCDPVTLLSSTFLSVLSRRNAWGKC